LNLVHFRRSMRVFILLTMAGLGAAASFAAEPLARFPFVFDGRIKIPLRVNDSAPIDVALDTAFPQKLLLIFHKETGEELGLKYIPAVDGANTTRLTEGDRIALPGVDLGKLPTGVINQSRADAPLFSLGVVGGAVFVPYVVEIDFEKRLITLYDPKTFAPEAGWEEVPLVIEQNMPILETSVRLDGGAEVPVRLIVETGWKHQLALAVNEGKKIATPARALRFLTGTGLRGDVFADNGRVSELKIGTHVLKSIVTGFVTPDQIPILGITKTDGPLGLSTLCRFNLVFDYSRGRMLIRPNRYYAGPSELNMAGLAVGKKVSGETVVQFVMEGSEAAKKGLKKGDVVMTVDGKPAGSYGFVELNRKFGRDGKTVKLKVARNGETREVRLKLKRIV